MLVRYTCFFMCRWDTEAVTQLTSAEEGTQFSLICDNSSCTSGMWMTVRSYGYTGSSCRASLQCQFSHEPSGFFCGWWTLDIFYMCCMWKASLVCVWLRELRGLRLDRRHSDKWVRQMASHCYIFSGGLKGFRNIWKFWNSPWICNYLVVLISKDPQ